MSHELVDYQIDQLEARLWINPKTGERRRYIDSSLVWDMLPAADNYGFDYKGADHERIMAAKFWFDSNNRLHIDNLVERGRIRIDTITDQFLDAVEKTATDLWATIDRCEDCYFLQVWRTTPDADYLVWEAAPSDLNKWCPDDEVNLNAAEELLQSDGYHILGMWETVVDDTTLWSVRIWREDTK